MIGILMVTHGHFSEGIEESARMLLGEQEQFLSLCLTEADDVDDFRRSVAEGIDSLDTGDGVLVLVDIFGGSPFNTAACWLKNKNIDCITGLNFPMLVAAFQDRENVRLKRMKGLCVEQGKQGIIDVRSYMEQ